MSLQMLIIHELTKRSIRRLENAHKPVIYSYEDDELKPPTGYIKKPPTLQLLIIRELTKRIYRVNNNTHTSLIYSRLDIIYDIYNK
jgi:hypothetical protein